jgi:hypothetical protein
MQHAERRTTRFAHGLFAAGQAEGAQVRHALAARLRHAQEFAAPNRAIVAVTGTVPGHAQNRRVELVLGHACECVRLMVLHADDRKARCVRVPRGGIVGMEIAGHDRRIDAEELRQVTDRAHESRARRQRGEIANVLADKRIRARGHRDGALEKRADREHRRGARRIHGGCRCPGHCRTHPVKMCGLRRVQGNR